MTTIQNALFAATLLAAGLTACASPLDGPDAVRSEIGDAPMAPVAPELARRWLDLARSEEGTLEIERFYEARGCSLLDHAAAARAELDGHAVVLVEYLLDCGDAGTPSVVTAFDADVTLSTEAAQWMTSYGVEQRPEDLSVELVELWESRAVARVIESSALEAPRTLSAEVDTAGDDLGVAQQALIEPVTGTGTARTCRYAQTQSRWDALNTAYRRCGTPNHVVHQPGWSLVSERILADGRCQVVTSHHYNCRSAPQLGSMSADAVDWALSRCSQYDPRVLGHDGLSMPSTCGGAVTVLQGSGPYDTVSWRDTSRCYQNVCW